MQEKLFFEGENGVDEFYVLAQTRISGINYILAADSDEDDAGCIILKDTSESEDTNSVYDLVEEEEEINAIIKVFEELLEDVDIEK